MASAPDFGDRAGDAPGDIRAAYAATNGLEDDPAQAGVVERLAGLQRRLLAAGPPSLLRRLLNLGRAEPPVRGIYLWGGVGRGKTMLMDLFFETLAIDAKRRIHFHRMMSEIHGRLTELGDTENPLDRVAADLARRVRVLCFDEFFVSDIGDAMILGGFLQGLFRRGVTLVATSNTPPAGLYADGLQRERFLPAIRQLEEHTEVVELDGGVDYRSLVIRRAGTWFLSSDDGARDRLDGCFRRIAPGRVEVAKQLDIAGRSVSTVLEAKGIVWFEFAEICEGPRSQQDYIEVARCYQTVIVSDVPVLTREREDAARRFIALVDEFYDRRVKLIVSASATPDRLYRGKRLANEFQRTQSRLAEMQSTEYLHSAHRA